MNRVLTAVRAWWLRKPTFIGDDLHAGWDRRRWDRWS
jgi:hypothetical protein